jgi:hypothetical protein
VETTDGAATIQQVTDAPSGFNNSLKVTVTSTDTSLGATQFIDVQTRIEGFNIADLGWGTASAKPVTLSFWVRSSLTGTFGGSFTNDSDRSYPFTYTISSADTWEQKSVTVVGDTTGTWATNNAKGILVTFGLGVGSTYSGTAGAWAGSFLLSATGAVNLMATNGATFYITGVQLEAGSVATPFERRDYGRELAMCQRYYEVLDLKSLMGTAGGFTVATAYFKTDKRAAPTLGTYVNSPQGALAAPTGTDFIGTRSVAFVTNTTSMNFSVPASAEL